MAQWYGVRRGTDAGSPPAERGARIATALALGAALALTAGGLGGCGGEGDGGGEQARGPGHGGPHGRPAEPAVPVAIQAAEVGDIASYYRSTATLEADKEAEVLARVQGVVEATVAEEGDRIGEGETLLRVDNDEYRLRLTQAEAATANLRARYERTLAMMDEQLATDEEFQTAKSDLASAEADEGLARLNLSYTIVKAPFTGRVTQRLVDVGQNISDGTPLYVMADFSPLLARVHVPAKEFRRLRKEQPVELVLDSDGTRLAGRIDLVSPIIDPTSGTIKLTIEVEEYPESTRPGDFAEVEIVTELRQGVTLVPRGAVVTEKGETVIFVTGPAPDDGEEEGEGDATAERRVVEVGFTDDLHTQIVSGIAPGEKLVIKGQRSLKHGSLLKILEDLTPGAEPPVRAQPAAADSAAVQGQGHGKGKRGRPGAHKKAGT